MIGGKVGLKEIFIGIILVSVFTFSMLAFGSQLSIDNNSTSVLDDPTLKSVNESIRGTLDKVNTRSESASEILTDSSNRLEGDKQSPLDLLTIIPTTLGFIGDAMVSVTVLIGIIGNIIGIPPILMNVLIGGLLLVVLLLAWRVWKVGGT